MPPFPFSSLAKSFKHYRCSWKRLCLRQSKHGLKIVSHMERRLCLALDFVDGDAIGNLDKGKPVDKVDVKDTLTPC